MNPAALSAAFAAHKTAILGAAAVGVAGLALWRKKNGGASAQPAGTIPAAAVVSAGGTTGAGGYDSSAYDVYAALQSELEPILQQYQATKQTGGGPGTGVTTAPKPVHSPILSQPKPPVAKKKPTPKPVYKDGFFRIAGENVTYHQDTAGNLSWVNKAQGERLQLRAGEKNAGKIQNVAKDSSFWKGRTFLSKPGSAK